MKVDLNLPLWVNIILAFALFLTGVRLWAGALKDFAKAKMYAAETEKNYAMRAELIDKVKQQLEDIQSKYKQALDKAYVDKTADKGYPEENGSS